MDVIQSPRSENSVRLLPSLTSLRVFAALFVAVHHTRTAWAHTHLVDMIGQIGWLGVSCFFILSGFVLMWGYNPTTTYREFMLRRLIRIYPLHFLCLLISLTGFVILHNPMAGYVGTPLGTIADFFLVHDWLPGHPNVRQAWNGVSWTLSCEFMFYLAAPPFFRFVLSGDSATQKFYRIVPLWAALLTISLVGQHQHWDAIQDFMIYHPLPRFVEFMLGAGGALLLREGWQFRSRSLSLVLMAIPVALYCMWNPESEGRSGAVLIELFIPGAFLLIMSMAKMDIDGYATLMQNRILVFFGEASFALYMIHALFLNIFTLVRNHIFPISNISHLWGEVTTLVFLILVLLISAVTHVWIEQPIRVFLMQKFGLFRIDLKEKMIEVPVAIQSSSAG